MGGLWGGRELAAVGVGTSAMLRSAVAQRKLSEEPAASSSEPTW